ncbi:MAG TPA: methyltransferase domain-containing protein [Acidimicrobiales bacterium]|nr:methyltransferase domain-containing protein [Acidimicrobiales bacterium]
MSDDGYLLDNRKAAAGARLDALAAVFDPVTFPHIDALGITGGWRCWEVGAGGPSVPRWLAGRVGSEGRVLATDIDVSWTRGGADSGVEVRRHDIARDDPPGETFDLVHARLVLVHVTDRDAALRSMVRSLSPGGWLLVEDADPALQPLSCLDPKRPEEELANRIRTGFRALMAQRGVDLAYGRKLPRLLRTAGLLDVAADAYFPVALPACGVLEATTVAVIRDQLVDDGIATDEEIESHLAAVATGRLDLAQPPMISAWGRVPGDRS